MSAIDDYLALKQERNELAEYIWSCEKAPAVRMFRENGNSWNEHLVSNANTDRIQWALGQQIGNTTGYRSVGKAIKTAVIAAIDERLFELARRAKAEAEACLAQLGGSENRK